VLIRVAREGGKVREISLKQNESAKLPDGSEIRFIDFRANLDPERQIGDENSPFFQNPAAIVELTSPEGSKRTAYVFRKNRKSAESSLNSFEGLDMSLVDFERVSETHVLFVQYDPGTAILYAGFLMLALSLAAVFFFSHRRVWIVIEDGPNDDLRVTIGGDTNRNQMSFERKFRKIVG
jgi:cytochrome c biogenesis protein